MKQIENYKPRIREKCRVCKIYLPAGSFNDICKKCSARRMYVIQLHEESILNE